MKGDVPHPGRAPDPDAVPAKTDSVVAEFQVHYRNYLDSKGALIGKPPAFANDPEIMVALARHDSRAPSTTGGRAPAHRPGQHLSLVLGQEAIGAGYASVMNEGTSCLSPTVSGPRRSCAA